jgi:hypothetical protein
MHQLCNESTSLVGQFYARAAALSADTCSSYNLLLLLLLLLRFSSIQVDPAPPISIIDVVKKGPSQSIEANTEFTFTLTASVPSGNVATMVLTDAIEASTGITFVKVAPTTGTLHSVQRCA